MSRNDIYTIENLLDHLYHEKYFKLIAGQRQRNTNIPQQIKFVGKLEEDHNATMLFIAKMILNF